MGNHKEMCKVQIPTTEKARSARQDGIDQSICSCKKLWQEYAIAYVHQYLKRNQTMFVDDLWKDGLLQPDSPRGLGAVIQQAVREGWISEQIHAGCVLARPSVRSNMQLKRTWLSNIYQGKTA